MASCHYRCHACAGLIYLILPKKTLKALITIGSSWDVIIPNIKIMPMYYVKVDINFLLCHLVPIRGWWWLYGCGEAFCLQVTRKRPCQTLGLSIVFLLQFLYRKRQRKNQNRRPILLCLILVWQSLSKRCKNIQHWRIKYTSAICSYILQNQAIRRD